MAAWNAQQTSHAGGPAHPLDAAYDRGIPTEQKAAGNALKGIFPYDEQGRLLLARQGNLYSTAHRASHLTQRFNRSQGSDQAVFFHLLLVCGGQEDSHMSKVRPRFVRGS